MSVKNSQPTPNDTFYQSNEPADNLPTSTKGKIQDIVKDPDIEAKRRANHQAAMRLNRNNLKHGKYSTNYPVPEVVLTHLEAMEDVELLGDQEISLRTA